MSLLTATFTKLDGKTIQIPIDQITGYSETWQYQENTAPSHTPTHVNTFQYTAIFMTDNQMIPVQEDGTEVHDAIYNAIDAHP